MIKRLGVIGALTLLAAMLGACGKPTEPPAAAAPAAAEERSVSVPVPSEVTAEAAVPAASAPAETAAPVPAASAETAAAVPAAPAEAAPAEPVPVPAESQTDAASPTPEAAPPLPEKIARVGDMVITTQEFMRDLAVRAAQLSQEQGQSVNPDDPTFRATALGEMIDARVLRSVASRAVTVTDEEVNREYERGRRVLGAEGKFQEYLKREGLDEAGLKALLRDRIAIEAFKKKKLDEAAVTEEEIQKLYDQWAAAGRFDRKERTADIQHLGVHPEGDQPADLEKAKQAVEAAHARIAAGESFSQVAVEVSDDKNVAQTGGLYPEVTPASLPPYVAERIFKQAPGELSEPFEGGKAWHLIKVLSVNEPGRVTFEKAHDQIRNYLLEMKREDALTKAIDQAKYLMDIEIYKAELRPKEGPGSTEDLRTPFEPPDRSSKGGAQAAPEPAASAAAP